MTSFGRNIREDDLHLLRLIHYFRHLLECLLAVGLIGLHTTDNEQTHIAMLNNGIRIRYQTDRRCIYHDIIVLLAQLRNRLTEFISVYQLTRVRRDISGTHEIKSERCVLDHHILQLTVANEVVAHTVTILQT